jgi:RNA polymerase sigma-70 factor, ECF subfamily
MLPATRCRDGLVHPGSDDRTDAELLTQIREGRADAKAQLFVRYRMTVTRVLRGMVGPDPDLEDLVQEVFLRALVAIAHASRPIELHPWLSALAVFTARDQFRRRRRRSVFLLPPADLPELAVSPRDQEGTEAIRGLADVLQQLPEDQSRAFSLRHVMGFELTDVAAACGVSLATIKRRLGAARENVMSLAGARPALRERIEESGWAIGGCANAPCASAARHR